jgi:hypothetical protein
VPVFLACLSVWHRASVTEAGFCLPSSPRREAEAQWWPQSRQRCFFSWLADLDRRHPGQERPREGRDRVLLEVRFLARHRPLRCAAAWEIPVRGARRPAGWPQARPGAPARACLPHRATSSRLVDARIASPLRRIRHSPGRSPRFCRLAPGDRNGDASIVPDRRRRASAPPRTRSSARPPGRRLPSQRRDHPSPPARHSRWLPSRGQGKFKRSARARARVRNAYVSSALSTPRATISVAAATETAAPARLTPPVTGVAPASNESIACEDEPAAIASSAL